MRFLTQLREGTHGICVDVPPSMQVVEEHELGALLHDDEHSVSWHIALMSPIDLAGEHANLLVSDIRQAARSAFEAHFRSGRATANGTPDLRPRPVLPRTSDPDWSPLVSVERVAIGEAASLFVVHRLAYEPGHETIAGQVLIPLETTTLHLSALSTGTFTGYRESALAERAPWVLSEPGRAIGTIGFRNC
jgi:hypothetical protein